MRTMIVLSLSVAVVTTGCQYPGRLANTNRHQNQWLTENRATTSTNYQTAHQSANVMRAQSHQTPPVKLAGWQDEQQKRYPALPLTAAQTEQPTVVGVVQRAETLPTPSSNGTGLSLEELEGIALGNNPALAEASAAVRAARGNWTQVGLLPNPVVGYSGQQLGSRGQAEQQGVYVGQQFVTGRKLRLNRETAAWEVQRAQRERDTMRMRVLSDTRIAFYDVMIAQQRKDLAGKLVEISNQGVEAAQALFRSEEVSEADPLRARVEAAQARILLQTARNQHLEAWQRLTAIIGMPQWQLQQVSGNLKPSNLELTFDETLHHILSSSPEIAAAMADVEAARWTLRRARVEAIPNLDVQAVFQDDRGTGSTNGNLQVTLPIPIFNRNQGAVREAQADVTGTQRAVDRLALDLQTRLAAAFQRYQTAYNQVERYTEKDGILENAQKTLDLIRAGYQGEEFSLVDLLTAQRTYFQANLAYLDSLRELWVSVMEIKGLLLKDSLAK